MNEIEHPYIQSFLFWMLILFMIWLVVAIKPVNADKAIAQYLAFLFFPVLMFIFPTIYFYHRKYLKWYRKKWLLMSINQLIKQIISPHKK